MGERMFAISEVDGECEGIQMVYPEDYVTWSELARRLIIIMMKDVGLDASIDILVHGHETVGREAGV